MNNYMNWFLYVFTLPPSPLRPLRDAATPSAAPFAPPFAAPSAARRRDSVRRCFAARYVRCSGVLITCK